MGSIIGKEIRGFRFTGGPSFPPGMDQYIDVIGTVVAKGYNYVTIQFPDNNKYLYPYHEAKQHLVEKDPLDELITNINTLIEKYEKRKLYR
jgi:hypothetical protein